MKLGRGRPNRMMRDGKKEGEGGSVNGGLLKDRERDGEKLNRL